MTEDANENTAPDGADGDISAGDARHLAYETAVEFLLATNPHAVALLKLSLPQQHSSVRSIAQRMVETAEEAIAIAKDRRSA